MATQTLTDLIASSRELANVENNNFVTDTELTKRVNEAIGELYDLVLAAYENYSAVWTDPFTLAGGVNGNFIDLSTVTTSFYKGLLLQWNPGTSNMRVVSRLASPLESDSASGMRFDIEGTPPILYVYPPLESKGVYRLKYAPDAPVLASGTDALDATLNKWYEFVTMRVAIGIHRKRQKTSEAMELAGDANNPQPGTLAYVRATLQSLVRNRVTQPQQVPLGRRRNAFWDWDDTP